MLQEGWDIIWLITCATINKRHVLVENSNKVIVRAMTIE